MSEADQSAYGATVNATRLAVELGEKVRDARETLHLSQRELAARMGRSPAVVSRLESGGVGSSMVTLQRAVDALDLTIDKKLQEIGRAHV